MLRCDVGVGSGAAVLRVSFDQVETVPNRSPTEQSTWASVRGEITRLPGQCSASGHAWVNYPTLLPRR